jgi:hypothetical protein
MAMKPVDFAELSIVEIENNVKFLEGVLAR